MRPLVITSSVEVPATPERVWAVLTDVETWQRWCPPVRRVTHVGPLEVGGRLAYVLSMGPGVPVSFDVELQIVDAPRCLQWWSTKWWGVTGTRAFRLEADGAGTVVHDIKTFESRIWPVALAYPSGTVRGMSDGWLLGLRDEVVRRAGQPGL